MIMVMRKKILKVFYWFLDAMMSDKFLKWSTAIESAILMVCINNILHLTSFRNAMLILGLMILIPIVIFFINVLIGVFILLPIQSLIQKNAF